MEGLTNGLFDNLQFWHWLVFAIVLVILEVFSPAAFFMWMGAAAGVTGLALLALPEMSWQIQFILFSVASIASILVGRTFFSRKSANTDDPTLSQLEHELTGNVYEVEKDIVNGSGRIKVGESTWKAQGPDSKAGSSVKVIGVKGAVLLVEPV
ncbi:NfeD family protein [uncultured Cocleimonas sp.]|uniref:NfeD family protein n=1 Tax=uncultured Cocleimonas sp. TaxID=1051587 RepID=UPI00261F2102|nr:NfeD family protein [uncultured Cocleimonas sp.]